MLILLDYHLYHLLLVVISCTEDLSQSLKNTALLQGYSKRQTYLYQICKVFKKEIIFSFSEIISIKKK